VQIDPIKQTLKAPGTKRLKLTHDELLSICFNFALNFNLRRYIMVPAADMMNHRFSPTCNFRINTDETHFELYTLSATGADRELFISVGQCRLTR
jgi:hypothetical protein